MTSEVAQPVVHRSSHWRILLMPWRWERWVWFAVVPLGLAMYFLSAVPVERLIQQKLRLPYGVITVVWTIYQPVFFFADHLDEVDVIVQWENDLMDKVIGPRVIRFGGFNSTPLEVISDSPADAWDVMAETLE